MSTYFLLVKVLISMSSVRHRAPVVTIYLPTQQVDLAGNGAGVSR